MGMARDSSIVTPRDALSSLSLILVCPVVFRHYTTQIEASSRHGGFPLDSGRTVPFDDFSFPCFGRGGHNLSVANSLLAILTFFP
jgi:hypothetical protein